MSEHAMRKRQVTVEMAWKALGSDIIRGAIADLRTRDPIRFLKSFWFLLSDGPFFLDALDVEIDLLPWIFEQRYFFFYNKTWNQRKLENRKEIPR